MFEYLRTFFFLIFWIYHQLLRFFTKFQTFPVQHDWLFYNEITPPGRMNCRKLLRVSDRIEVVHLKQVDLLHHEPVVTAVSTQIWATRSARVVKWLQLVIRLRAAVSAALGMQAQIRLINLVHEVKVVFHLIASINLLPVLAEESGVAAPFCMLKGTQFYLVKCLGLIRWIILLY